MANGADGPPFGRLGATSKAPSLGKLGMASFFIASLFLAGHGGSTTAPPSSTISTGHELCPCIDPWSRGFESDPQHAPVVPKAGCNMTRDGDGVCYPASYGSSNCAAHDLPLTPECTRLDEAERPSWCSKEWCYVDPANCAMPNQATEYFHVRPSGRCARPAPAWHLLPSASASRRAPDGHEDGGSQAWNLQLRSPGTGTHAYATDWRGPTLTVRGPPVAIPPGAPQAP